ncbi:MAG TPA: hypothetical protein VFY95_08275 [Sphingomicrobium sp.]
MPDHAGFAAALTVREHVLRFALQAGYSNGSDSGKKFVEDLSGSGIGMLPDILLGQPDIDCEGATNLLVVTLPMWGQVTVTVDQVAHAVDMNGVMELTLTPILRKGIEANHTESSVVLDQFNTAIDARHWTATVTSAGTPPDIAALISGDEFRSRFEQTFRQGVFVGRIALPAIDASFLGPLVRKSTSVAGKVRNGVLLVGLNYTDDTHELVGDAEALQDFARSNDVAGVVHPDAVDIMLDDLHTRMIDGVADEGATLDSFQVRARDGYFRVNGAASNSEGTVNFSFRVVPSMFHTRPGVNFQYLKKPRRVYSRTWAALEFHIEGVETNVDRAWWVVLFGEVILGILTVGLSILYVEGLVSAAAASFSGRIEAAKSGAAARIRRTIPPPGGISVRIGLDQFEITESGVFIGISVRATASPALLLGPTTVPATYRNDVLRYIVRPPSGVARNDPRLRIRWTLEDRTNNVVLQDTDGSAVGRLVFEFSPASSTATDFGVVARLYRQLGVTVSDLATQSVNLHIRSALPPDAYVRWRWQGSNPQIAVDETSDIWTYRGEVRVDRYSEWHRTDAPCRSVSVPARYRFEIEKADRLPFSLRLLENHRKGLCPYCFYGGPAGINPNL